MYESILSTALQAPDMVSYLDRHRVVYESPPLTGFDGLPLGNGSLSAMAWHTPRSLEIHLNHADAHDRRQSGEFRAWSWEGEERHSVQVSVGHITMEDSLPSFDPAYLRDYRAILDIGRAEAVVASVTPFSCWNLTAFCGRDPSVLILDAEISSAEPVERTIRLERWGTRSFTHWYEQIVDDRSVRCGGTRAAAHRRCGVVAQDLEGSRIASALTVVGTRASVRVLHGHAVEVRLPAAARARFQVVVTAVVGSPGENLERQALEILRTAVADLSGVRERHRERWREYWNRSFVMLPDDDYLENLYYLHFYSLFSCGLGRHPANFSGGGWTWNGDARNWGHLYHWNQQQLLWAVNAAGRPELAKSYLDFCSKLLPTARHDAARLFDADGAFFSDIANVDLRQALEPDTVRNLTVGPQIALAFFDHFLFTGDLDYLRERCIPLLDSCLALYARLLRPCSDGLLRIAGGSTCYESYWVLKETLTDGSAIRALAAAHRAAHAAAGEGTQSPEELLPEGALPRLPVVGVKDAGGNPLAIFSPGVKWDGAPVDFEEGVYPDSPFPATLLAPVVPFGIIGLDDTGLPPFATARNTLRVLIDTNILREGPYGCSGHTPAPKAAARLGMKEDVLPILRLYVQRYQRFANGFMHYASRTDHHYDGGRGFFTPRELSGSETETRYTEIHDKSKGLRRRLASDRFLHMYYESSSNLAAGIQEMLLQSHEACIRVFAGFPGAGTAAFSLEARGGFRITSETRDGRVAYVRVESHRRGCLRIELPWRGPTGLRRDGKEAGLVEPLMSVPALEMDAGESLLLFPADRPPEHSYIDPVPERANEAPKKCGLASLGLERIS